MEYIILLVSLTVFISYIYYVVSNFGVLPSISASYYYHNKRLLFALFIIATVWPLGYLVQQSVFMQLAVGLISFVGVAASFKSDTIEKYIHAFGAIFGFSLGFLALSFSFGFWSLLILMVTFIIIFNILKIRNKLWWSEIVGYLLLLIGVFFKIKLGY